MEFAFIAIALIIGTILGYLGRQETAKRRAETAESKFKKTLEEAKKKGEKIIEEFKKEERERRQQLNTLESHLAKKEERLSNNEERLLVHQEEIKEKIKQLKSGKEELENLRKEETKKLEEIARLSKEDAKIELIKNIEQDNQKEIIKKIKKLGEESENEIDKKAKELLAISMQRMASSQSSETTTTTVALPNDDMKGRIIGKEGRNIRSLESLCGVDIIVDDTPGMILISGFSPLRRQIAKLALEKLILDGRIQPARIEEAVEQARKEINQKVKDAGEAALYELGITGLDPSLIQLIGSLMFRTSYGQNVLVHSLEVANLGSMLSEELGADTTIVKKACLLHDIGKAVDHEIEGTHIEIGKKILKKFNAPEDIINAMQAHHEDYPFESLESRIVQVADALSSSRPGARKDTLENYLKRLEELEKVATSFDGIDKAYAIQAGREVRVFVKPKEISDLEAVKLSKTIAKRIEKELTYPGEIKISVIRETRFTNYAK